MLCCERVLSQILWTRRFGSLAVVRRNLWLARCGADDDAAGQITLGLLEQSSRCLTNLTTITI